MIRPKTGEAVTTEYMTGEAVPTLAPPPKSPIQNTDATLRFNPFDKSNELVATAITASTDEPALPQGGCKMQICRINAYRAAVNPSQEIMLSQNVIIQHVNIDNFISLFYTKAQIILCSSHISTHITGIMDIKVIYKATLCLS